MNTQSTSKNNTMSGRSSNAGRIETANKGERILEWRMDNSQSSTTTTRGATGGGGRYGEKKPDHRFSSGVPKSGGYAMQQFMGESQSPRGSAPWTPVWTFPKGGGGKQK